MSRDTERQYLEWLAANQSRFVTYSMSIVTAYAYARQVWYRDEGTAYPLSLGQFRRVALYARTTGYLREWRGTPPAMRADLPGQSFFDFVAA